MFVIKGGDFPKTTVLKNGKLVWDSNKVYSLEGNIDNLELLPSENSKVNFVIHLRDGKKLVATSDTETYQEIHVLKLTKPNNIKNSKKDSSGNKKNNNLSVIFIGAGIGIIVSIILILFIFLLLNKVDQEQDFNQPVMEQKEQEENLNSPSELISELTKGEEKLVVEFLDKLDISNITNFQRDTHLDNLTYDDIGVFSRGEEKIFKNGEKGYLVSTEYISDISVYLDKDNKVVHVSYLDYDLYSDGKIGFKASQFYITDLEYELYQSVSNEVVKSILKAPSTAQFPKLDETNTWKDPEGISIRSYVDSQNSFGAMLRAPFFIYSSFDGEIMHFEFDGKTIIEKIPSTE